MVNALNAPNTVVAPTAPWGDGRVAAAPSTHTMPVPRPPLTAEIPATPEDLAAALQKHAERAGAELSFRVDEELGRIVITVLDRRDGTILRQIPSEEAMRIARYLAEQISHVVDTVA